MHRTSKNQKVYVQSKCPFFLKYRNLTRMYRYNLIIIYLGWCLMGANTQHLLIINEVIQRTIQVMPTQIDQFPILAQVLKYYFETKQFQQQCAGVILTSYHVLSAAHCFPVGMDVRNWMICVGSSYRSSGGVLHNVKAIKVHEKYDKSKNTNDIAIVEVTNPFTFNSNVRQARILSYGSEISPNSACTLVGWGALKRYGPQPEQLKLTNVVTIDQCDCIRRYGTIGRIIRNSMICAIRIDGRQSAACKGDSGGPLIYNGVVVGLVSFGVWCQNPDYPAVYTKVSYYTEWIKRTTSVI